MMQDIMLLDIALWSVLVMIGVSDAQRHRIPNRYVLLMLGLVLTKLWLTPEVVWSSHLLGFVVTFAVCLLFYVVKAMAAGDVKLLAVVGLWVGATGMKSVALYVTLAGGVIALFYLLHSLAPLRVNLAQASQQYVMRKLTPGMVGSKAVIPFAPAIVVGLALYFYLS